MPTKIEWVKNEDGSAGLTINPIKGLCPIDCKDNYGKPYCYARRIYKRFHWKEELTYDKNVFTQLIKLPPSRVFVGSTMELFGNWIKPEWRIDIFNAVDYLSQHTFIFLTKQPQNLPKEFPSNCWVGVSATDHLMFAAAYYHLTDIKAKVKFVSIEPLLSWDERRGFTQALINQAKQAGVNWLITGLRTPYSKKTAPKIECVKTIVESTDKAKLPMFLKNNLVSLWEKNNLLFPKWALRQGSSTLLRQEFPKTI